MIKVVPGQLWAPYGVCVVDSHLSYVHCHISQQPWAKQVAHRLPTGSRITVKEFDGAKTLLSEFEIFAPFMSLEDVIKILCSLHAHPPFITSTHRVQYQRGSDCSIVVQAVTLIDVGRSGEV